MRATRFLVISVLGLAAAGCAMSAPSFKLGGPGNDPGLQPQRVPSPPSYSPPLPTARLAPAASNANRAGTVVEVRDGDTLVEIAKKHNVPISVIVGENRLTDLNVFPGMRLFIPKL